MNKKDYIFHKFNVNIFLSLLFFWIFYYDKLNAKKQSEDFSSVVKDEQEVINDKIEDKDDEILTNIEGKQVDKDGNEINFENLGNFWLEINPDNVKIKAPIVEGVEAKNLDQGIGHHTETAFPNEENGNIVCKKPKRCLHKLLK